MSTLLGLQAWHDDLNVVLFKFLEDDTKPNQPTNQPTKKHNTTHNTTESSSTRRKANAWTHAQQATDLDLKGSNQQKSKCLCMYSSDKRPWSWESQREYLDMCTVGNRPWSWDEKVNAWTCAPRSNDHHLALDQKSAVSVTSVIFLRIYCFGMNKIP